MAVIKLVEDYAVASLRRDVRDSLTLAGEQTVLLNLFHPSDTDALPCPQCGDDIYKSPEKNCTSCYGTMYDGGVRSAQKVWALFTDQQINEELSNRGVVDPDNRHIQFEAFPLVKEHDVVVRVRHWSAEGTPSELEGYYLLGKVDRRSLRTGSRFGQANWDVVGQKADLAQLPDHLGAITNYPVLGKTFSPPPQLVPATPTLPAHAVVQPDTRVVYFPFGTGATTGGKYAVTVGDGVNTQYIVTHNLGTLDVAVTLYDTTTGEEVEVDVAHNGPNTVLLVFGAPPPAGGYRVVVG